MAKVLTGKNLNEFISTGAGVEQIKADPKAIVAKEAPALEVKQEKLISDLSLPTKEDLQERAKPLAEEDIYAEEDKETKEEITKAKRFDALMRKKHRAMKEAQELAQENERFAENQYNRARLAEERAATIEQELAKIRADAQKTVEPAAKLKPDPQKYTDDKGQFKAFEYAEDLARWSSDQSVAEYAKNQEKQRRDAETAEAQAKAHALVAAAEKKYPDYKEVVDRADVKTHTAVLEYLTASEYIGDVSYYMSTHPEFVERINRLHPLKAIAEVGKLELTFEKPPEAPKAQPVAPQAVSGAPAPIVPLEVSKSVDVQTDPAKMDYKQLRAYERERERNKRHR